MLVFKVGGLDTIEKLDVSTQEKSGYYEGMDYMDVICIIWMWNTEKQHKHVHNPTNYKQL